MRITYYHFTSVDSTNSWPKCHKNELAKDGLAIITADEQTQGRGRHKRPWHSPKGKNLYLSFAFFEDASAFSPFFFAQLASLCLCDLLKNHGIHAQIKWPNDLVVDGKKIAGILCEKDESLVVLGIGLNVNMNEDDLRSIPKAATSMQLETGKTHPLHTIQDELVDAFLQAMQTAKKEGAKQFEEAWQKATQWMLSKEIEVQENNKVLRGKIIAIEKDASITLCLDNGAIYTVRSGDLFLR